MIVSGNSPQLEYSPRSSNPMRGSACWLLAGALCLTFYFDRSWPADLWQDFGIYRLQNKCIKSPVAPDTLVYSSGTPVMGIRSTQVAALCAAYPIRFAWTPRQTLCTVFVGELQATNGLRRLVTVEAGVEWTPGHHVKVTLTAIASQLGRTALIRCNGGASDYLWGAAATPPTPEATIHSAILDPIDRSHITFRIQLFDQTEPYDGYLKTDGNIVLIPQNRMPGRIPSPLISAKKRSVSH